uniref:C2 NT-type domain-containing protein n=1 Tax=Romanomermis culicivorax TaxID=13658 RepID=A0A915IZ68_ROMCU
MLLRNCFENTMTFMMKKKKFKFMVDFSLIDLNNVPYVNAVLFTKIRLLEGGGSFSQLSPRVSVVNHHIRWNKSFQFSCRITSCPQTGVLEPRICRVSIRKELKGGKSYQKLGFCDINLSEYAGTGVTGMTRSYLLEGYDSGHQRQDNSILTVNITMTLQSSDPFFRVPTNAHALRSSGTSLFNVDYQANASLQFLNPSDRRAPASSVGGDSYSNKSTVGSSSTYNLTLQQQQQPESLGKASYKTSSAAGIRPLVAQFTAGLDDDASERHSPYGWTVPSSHSSVVGPCDNSSFVPDDVHSNKTSESSAPIANAQNSVQSQQAAAIPNHSRHSSAESSAAIFVAAAAVNRRLQECTSGTGSTSAAVTGGQSTPSTSVTIVTCPSGGLLSATNNSSVTSTACNRGSSSSIAGARQTVSLKKRISSMESHIGSGHNSRMDNTRVDANKLVDDLIKNFDLRHKLDLESSSSSDRRIVDDVENVATCSNSYVNVSGTTTDFDHFVSSSHANYSSAVGGSQDRLSHPNNNHLNALPMISLATNANDSSSSSTVAVSSSSFATFPKRSKDFR